MQMEHTLHGSTRVETLLFKSFCSFRYGLIFDM